MKKGLVGAALAACLGLAVAPAHAGTGLEAEAPGPSPAPPGFWHAGRATGDWGGARTRMEDAGVVLGFSHCGDFLADATGSQTHHAAWFGVFHATLDLDLKRMAGDDAEVFVDGMWQYGRNLSGQYLNVNTLTSTLAGPDSLRLAAAWFRQGFLDGRLQLKLGQLGEADAFGATDFVDIFVNDELGYAPNNLFYTSQPYSPAGKPGVIGKADLRDLVPGLYVQGGAFPAVRNAYRPDDDGLHYRSDFDQGAALSGEVGWIDPGGGLAAYKLGCNLTDQHPFADLSGGAPRRGNWNVYGLAEKSVFHPLLSDGKPDPGRGLDLLVEVVGGPADRNFLFLEATLGVRYTGPWSSRPADKVGLGLVRSQDSPDADRASRASGGPALDGETVIELDYQYQACPWFLIQPDLQAIVDPRGDSGRSDIVVAGLRTTVTF